MSSVSAPRKGHCALCGEFFEKAAAQLETVPRQLTYQLPKDPIYTLADPQELERAFLNLLSNAAKFTSPQDRILCSLQPAAFPV